VVERLAKRTQREPAVAGLIEHTFGGEMNSGDLPIGAGAIVQSEHGSSWVDRFVT
jgi:hypothetical protein